MDVVFRSSANYSSREAHSLLITNTTRRSWLLDKSSSSVTIITTTTITTASNAGTTSSSSSSHDKFCHIITNHQSLCVVVFRIVIAARNKIIYQWTDYMVVEYGVQTADGSLSQ
jgi:hypothetical protein